HTQNIKPWWNFAIDYRKVNSPGFYKIQRNNHDAASFTTHYQSKDHHYELYGALIYNKMQHDENGGIVSDSELLDPNYTDRRTLHVAFDNQTYSLTRSSITNMQRDFTMQVLHSYTWGHGDTLYNE